MGTKHFPNTIRERMEEMRIAGHTHREIAEQTGYTKKQADKFFERLNKKTRMAKINHIPKKKGPPRRYPPTAQEEMTLRIKELEREVALLRSFLRAAGRM